MSKRLYKTIAVFLVFTMLTVGVLEQRIKNITAMPESILTSSLIDVEGFQIKASEAEWGVTFRAVCVAPNIGSTIVVGEKDYIVENLGVIYSKDPNNTGNNQNNYLDKSYTELDLVPYYEEGKIFQFKYVGKYDYQGENLTYGYIATKDAIAQKDSSSTKYVFSMKDMDCYMTNTIRVRAFVEAIDKEGKEVVIYGEYASLMSIAEIAYNAYATGNVPDERTHRYLYDRILNKIPTDNPYYKETEEEYGWGGSIII